MSMQPRRAKHAVMNDGRARMPSFVANPCRREPPLSGDGLAPIAFADAAPRTVRLRTVLTRGFTERSIGNREVIQIAKCVLQPRQRGNEFFATGLMMPEGLGEEFRRVPQFLGLDPGAMPCRRIERRHVLAGLVQFAAQSVQRDTASAEAVPSRSSTPGSGAVQRMNGLSSHPIARWPNNEASTAIRRTCWRKQPTRSNKASTSAGLYHVTIESCLVTDQSTLPPSSSHACTEA